MKAVRLHELGRWDSLRCEEVPMPLPGPAEVRIAIHRAALSFTDVALAEGRLPGAPAIPFVPGVEAAGVIDAIGASVSGLVVGTRVVALVPNHGAFAEYAVAPADHVLPLPADLSFDDALALPVAASTAWLALRRGARLRGGESVFVPSAAGAIGSWLVQLAKALGAAYVVGTASAEAKRELARGLGADAMLEEDAEWPERVRELTRGRGADVVFVRGGGEDVARGLAALAPEGRLVLFGAETMFDASLTREQMTAFLVRNQTLVGFATFTLPLDERWSAAKDAAELLVRGRVRAVRGTTHRLDDLGQAFGAIAARTSVGKTVVEVR